MRLYSYVVAFDSGFAPNPFWNILTLACCKPKIRLTAQPGDLVVGLERAAHGNGVAYVAKVEEKLTFREYWRDERFLAKRPDMNASSIVKRCGDNIYEPIEAGSFRQLPSGHSFGLEENPANKKHDLNGRFVLTSTVFSYFGVDGIPLPKRFSSLIVGRAHRCHFPDELVTEFDAWRKSLPKGVRSRPRRWPAEDSSWRQRP